MNDPATSETTNSSWKVCSICKTRLPFGEKYFQCSVSTCQRKRTGLFFCSLACFEAHLPTARHRDAWAEEESAPSREAWLRQQDEAQVAAPAPPDTTGQRRIISGGAGETSKDVLVVVSKLKKFVREATGMNTSDTAIGPLSDHLRELCRRAADAAQRDGRRTLLDRDIQAALRGE